MIVTDDLGRPAIRSCCYPVVLLGGLSSLIERLAFTFWWWTLVWAIPPTELPAGRVEQYGWRPTRKGALRSAHRAIRRVARQRSSVEVIRLDGGDA